MRTTLSPKLTVKSPRNTIETPTSHPNRLPNIKERNSTNPGKIFNMTPFELKSEDHTKSTKPKALNLFDIQSPVDERKVAIVKSTLENRNVFSPQLRTIPKEDSTNLIRKDLAKCKSELDQQVSFLKEKKLGKKIQQVAEKVKTMTQSIEFEKFDKLRVPETHFLQKSGSAEVISSLSKNQSISVESQSIDKNDVSQSDSSCKMDTSLQQDRNKTSAALENELKSLKNQVSLLKTENLELVEELFKAKQEKSDLSQELDRTSREVIEFKLILDNQIKLLHDEIKLKDQDYENLKDQLKKSEFNRKKFVEAIKDLEVELNLAKKKNENLIRSFEELQLKHDKNLEALSIEKQKIYLIDELKEEIENARYQVDMIKDENNQIKIETQIAKESLDVVRKNFDNSRIAWRDKEIEYEKMIENMMEQVNSEKARTALQAAEAAKLRKTMTLKDNDSFNNFSKEEISRFQQKIIQLDKENGELTSEVEKLRKNIEYFSFLNKNKEEVIQKLESENTSLKFISSSSIFDFSKTNLKLLETYIHDWMVCQKCKEGVSMYLSHPCSHILCSKCEPASKTCPICSHGLTHTTLFTDFNNLREISSILPRLSLNSQI